jgi:hypothetical protein
LAAATGSYHYQLDLENKAVRGPDLRGLHTHGFKLDFPRDYSLKAYVEHRGVQISDDESTYFRGLVDRKIRLLFSFLVGSSLLLVTCRLTG